MYFNVTIIESEAVQELVLVWAISHVTFKIYQRQALFKISKVFWRREKLPNLAKRSNLVYAGKYTCY